MRGRIKMGAGSEVWSIGDVADYFGVSVRSIRGYYAKGRRVRPCGRDFSRLPRYRIGGDWRWFQDEVRRFARTGSV